MFLATQGQDMLERPAPRRLLRPCFGHELLDSRDSFHLTAQGFFMRVCYLASELTAEIRATPK